MTRPVPHWQLLLALLALVQLALPIPAAGMVCAQDGAADCCCVEVEEPPACCGESDPAAPLPDDDPTCPCMDQATPPPARGAAPGPRDPGVELALGPCVQAASQAAATPVHVRSPLPRARAPVHIVYGVYLS